MAMNPLRSALAGLVPTAATDREPTPPVEPVCIACRGLGWVRRDLPVTHPNFGEAVPCAVCGVVEQQRTARWLAEAQIPERFKECRFETYQVTPRTQDALAACRAWAAAPAHRDPIGLFLEGAAGTGKTGLAVSILHALRESEGLFLWVPDLLDVMRATFGTGSERTEADILAMARSERLVVLDDLGSEKPSEWTREKLFQIIGYRHDGLLDTVITSNYGIAKLVSGGWLSEPTGHRITEMCQVVRVDGPNLRAQGGGEMTR